MEETSVPIECMESNKDEKIACEKGAMHCLFILLTQCNVSLVCGARVNRIDGQWAAERINNLQLSVRGKLSSLCEGGPSPEANPLPRFNPLQPSLSLDRFSFSVLHMGMQGPPTLVSLRGSHSISLWAIRYRITHALCGTPLESGLSSWVQQLTYQCKGSTKRWLQLKSRLQVNLLSPILFPSLFSPVCGWQRDSSFMQKDRFN